MSPFRGTSEQLVHWDSPIFWIHRTNTPIVLLHGEEDDSCPVGQAIEFHTALEWKGVPSELVIYPREGNGIAGYEHQLGLLSRGTGWFERLLPAKVRDHE